MTTKYDIEKMLPEKDTIDWNKNDGWSKSEQVGRNQAIEDSAHALADREASVEDIEELMRSHWQESSGRTSGFGHSSVSFHIPTVAKALREKFIILRR